MSNDEEFAYISVDYDGGKPETFRCYIVEYMGQKNTFQTDEEAVSHAEMLGAFYFHTQSVDEYEEEKRASSEHAFLTAIAEIEEGLKEDHAEADSLFERVKDSDDPELVKHARFAVELANEALQKVETAKLHRVWNDISKRLVHDAKQDNTGCRTNIRTVKNMLGE